MISHNSRGLSFPLITRDRANFPPSPLPPGHFTAAGTTARLGRGGRRVFAISRRAISLARTMAERTKCVPFKEKPAAPNATITLSCPR